MDDPLLTPLRPWREVAEELLREPNTGRMGKLLKELNQSFEEERRVACDEDETDSTSFQTLPKLG